MKLMQKIYIVLFALLYLAVALVSTIHALEFFSLANNSWMSVILAISFELGQAAVLFSLLTSKHERGKIMPWVLMSIFTLVQVLGNVYSCYKHIILNSPENLRFFKEPIFIWTNLPDDQATVIVTYIVGAILPICALLLTSMVTNQFQNPNDTIIDLEDGDVQKNEVFKNNEQEQNIEHIEVPTTTSTEKPIVTTTEKPIEATTTTSTEKPIEATTTTEEPKIADIISRIDVEEDNQYNDENLEEFDPILQKLKKSEQNTNKQSRFINLTDF
jgi:hypothetical protein